MPDASLRVLHLPPSDAPASYISLLTSALQPHRVVAVPPPASLWRVGRSRSADVVHLHWLEFIAPSDGRPVTGLARTLARQTKLAAGLCWLRLRGVKVVWTVHNLAPHEPVRPHLERVLGRVVSRLADHVIAHSQYAKARIEQRWGRLSTITVIPHANYIGVFPPAQRPRAQMRERMHIPADAFVFLAFGQVRPYKRLPELVEAFSALPGADLRLVIAGRAVVAAEAERVRRAAAADPRVMLELRDIPDAEVTGLHRAADAGVLAYRDVFSSGALLLALSHGLPVVVPDEGTAREVAGDAASETFAPGELGAAMDRMRALDPKAASAAALAVAERHDWSEAGARTAALYGTAPATRPSRRQAATATSRNWLSKTVLHSDSE
jgi:beta-1,4-mannosyltransferase